MKKLIKIMFGVIIGASVLVGGVALAYNWAGEGHGRGDGGMYGHGSGMSQLEQEGRHKY